MVEERRAEGMRRRNAQDDEDDSGDDDGSLDRGGRAPRPERASREDRDQLVEEAPDPMPDTDDGSDANTGNEPGAAPRAERRPERRTDDDVPDPEQQQARRQQQSSSNAERLRDVQRQTGTVEGVSEARAQQVRQRVSSRFARVDPDEVDVRREDGEVVASLPEGVQRSAVASRVAEDTALRQAGGPSRIEGVADTPDGRTRQQVGSAADQDDVEEGPVDPDDVVVRRSDSPARVERASTEARQRVAEAAEAGESPRYTASLDEGARRDLARQQAAQQSAFDEDELDVEREDGELVVRPNEAAVEAQQQAGDDSVVQEEVLFSKQREALGLGTEGPSVTRTGLEAGSRVVDEEVVGRGADFVSFAASPALDRLEDAGAVEAAQFGRGIGSGVQSGAEALEPFSFARGTVEGAEFFADVAQEGGLTLGGGFTGRGFATGVSATPPTERSETLDEANQAAAAAAQGAVVEFQARPFQTSGRAFGELAATAVAPAAVGRGASAAGRATRRARFRPRTRALLSDERGTAGVPTGRTRRRGSDADAQDSTPTIDDDLQDALSRFESAERSRRAQRGANRRVERQRELRQQRQQSPSFEGGEIASRSVSRREVRTVSRREGRTVSRGPDTSRSGPTAQQRRAARGRSRPDDDLTPRERMLEAQRDADAAEDAAGTSAGRAATDAAGEGAAAQASARSGGAGLLAAAQRPQVRLDDEVVGQQEDLSVPALDGAVTSTLAARSDADLDSSALVERAQERTDTDVSAGVDTLTGAQSDQDIAVDVSTDVAQGERAREAAQPGQRSRARSRAATRSALDNVQRAAQTPAFGSAESVAVTSLGRAAATPRRIRRPRDIELPDERDDDRRRRRGDDAESRFEYSVADPSEILGGIDE